MTSVVRSITPTYLPTRYSLTNVSKVANATTALHSLSKDRAWHFGSGASANVGTLRMSNDDCATWTDIHTFNTGNPNEVVQGVIELPDGEVLVGTGYTGANTYGWVYKSSGWGTTLAQHQAATWTLVLSTRGGAFTDVWGFNQKGCGSNGVVVISTYAGGQTGTSGSDATEIYKARYVYLSQDNGATWNLIYDVYLQSQAMYAQSCHIHAVIYQQAWDRIWVTFGDSGGQAALVAGPGNAFVAYSDDRGATWTYLPKPAILTSAICQFTSLMVTPDAVMFLMDYQSYNIMLVLPVSGYRTIGTPRIDPMPPSNGAVGKSFCSAGPVGAAVQAGLPILYGCNLSNPTDGAHLPEIRCSANGVDFYPLYTDPAPVNGSSAFAAPITGPSLRGKIVAQYESGYLIGTLSGPA